MTFLRVTQLPLKANDVTRIQNEHILKDISDIVEPVLKFRDLDSECSICGAHIDSEAIPEDDPVYWYVVTPELALHLEQAGETVLHSGHYKIWRCTSAAMPGACEGFLQACSALVARGL